MTHYEGITPEEYRDKRDEHYYKEILLGISIIAATSILTLGCLGFYLSKINKNLEGLNKSNKVLIERFEKISPLEKEAGK